MRALPRPSFCRGTEKAIHVGSVFRTARKLFDSQRAQAQAQNTFVVIENVAGDTGRGSRADNQRGNVATAFYAGSIGIVSRIRLRTLFASLIKDDHEKSAAFKGVGFDQRIEVGLKPGIDGLQGAMIAARRISPDPRDGMPVVV